MMLERNLSLDAIASKPISLWTRSGKWPTRTGSRFARINASHDNGAAPERRGRPINRRCSGTR